MLCDVFLVLTKCHVYCTDSEGAEHKKAGHFQNMA